MGFDPKTQVYTSDGWKTFPNISSNDEVFVPLDLDKGARFVPVIQKVWDDGYKDFMVRAQSNSINMLVSEKQPVCIHENDNIKSVPASYIVGKDFRYPFGIFVHSPQVEAEPILLKMMIGQEEVENSYNREALFKLLFVFPLVGSVEKGGGKKQRIVLKVNGRTSSRRALQFSKLLEVVYACGVDKNVVHTNITSLKITINDSVLSGFMRNIDNGVNSKIPADIVLEMTSGISKNVVSFLSIVTGLYPSVYSALLADQYQLLYLMAGMFCKINMTENVVDPAEAGIDESKFSEEHKGKVKVVFVRYDLLPSKYEAHLAPVRRKHTSTCEAASITDLIVYSLKAPAGFVLCRREGIPFWGVIFNEEIKEK